MLKRIIHIACLLVLFTSAKNASNSIYVIKIDGAINPAVSDYVHTSISDAIEDSAECLIVTLNTPGGLLKSTRAIVSDFLQSKIPVVVYIYPSGSQGASAGVFITLAGNIAAMAPGTNIGAAHPVSLQGGQDSVMMGKATNDAAAFIRAISKQRNRNIKWAEDAVRKSLSLSDSEALEKNVIDLIAENIDELIKKINGMEVETTSGKKVLSTSDKDVINIEMTFAQQLLSILSDPNIAYILFMLGIYGLIFELYSPGSIIPGVIGGICIILAFYSLHTLPVNYAGLALIIFAIILYILEIKIVSHGVLSVGGTVSLLLGSIMLIDVESALEVIEISTEVIVTVTVLTLLFFIFAVGLGIRAQTRKPTTGAEGIIGEIGETITPLDPYGKIKIHGEIWKAKSIDGTIDNSYKVEAVEIENLLIKVKKIN